MNILASPYILISITKGFKLTLSDLVAKIYKSVPSNVWFELEKTCCFLKKVLLSGETSVTYFHIYVN